LGILERRPKVIEYWQAIRQCGFQSIGIDVFETYRGTARGVYSWIVNVRQSTLEVVRGRFKPVVWLPLSAILFLPYRWAARLAVFANGGNLFMRGSKPKKV
jgi:hypothetical protein